MSVEQVKQKCIETVQNSPEIKIIHELTTKIHKLSFELFFSDNTYVYLPQEFPYSYCSIPTTSPGRQRTFLMKHGYGAENPFTSQFELLADMASLLQYRPQRESLQPTYALAASQIRAPLNIFMLQIQSKCRADGIPFPPPPTSDESWEKRSWEHLNRTISIDIDSVIETKEILRANRNNAISGVIDGKRQEHLNLVYKLIHLLFLNPGLLDLIGNLQK